MCCSVCFLFRAACFSNFVVKKVGIQGENFDYVYEPYLKRPVCFIVNDIENKFKIDFQTNSYRAVSCKIHFWTKFGRKKY